MSSQAPRSGVHLCTRKWDLSPNADAQMQPHTDATTHVVMRSDPIQIIIILFTAFSFCFSCQHNFVFARLGSPPKTSMSQPCQLTLLFNQPTFSLATTLPFNSHATCWHESIRWSKIISELININFTKSTHYLDWTTLFMLSVYIKIAATMMVRES